MRNCTDVYNLLALHLRLQKDVVWGGRSKCNFIPKSHHATWSASPTSAGPLQPPWRKVQTHKHSKIRTPLDLHYTAGFASVQKSVSLCYFLQKCKNKTTNREGLSRNITTLCLNDLNEERFWGDWILTIIWRHWILTQNTVSVTLIQKHCLQPLKTCINGASVFSAESTSTSAGADVESNSLFFLPNNVGKCEKFQFDCCFGANVTLHIWAQWCSHIPMGKILYCI